MLLDDAGHQKPGRPGRTERRRGEAKSVSGRDEASAARYGRDGSGRACLLEQALTRENLVIAWKRVKANNGSAGVDGLSITDTIERLKTHWPQIRADLLAGRYRPQPVCRVQSPKSGGGMRELGIPTVTDRLIQQSLLQVLQPRIDPTSSEYSYGFRPGRGAHDAVLQAQRYVQGSYRIVVDVDLEKFFDRVNHDVLMHRLSKHIEDKAVLRLIRRYLQAGAIAQRRGHRFVRYADDCNVYVRSQKAGERVLRGLRKLYERLHLKVNEAKSAVTNAFGRKLLGYCLRAGPGGTAKRAIAGKSIVNFEQHVRQLTRRNGGRSLVQVAIDLRRYVLGWKAYFHLAQTPTVLRSLDEWMRHRLRANQLKHWRRGTTVYRSLRAMAATQDQAACIASSTRRWWWNSVQGLNRLMPIVYFYRLS